MSRKIVVTHRKSLLKKYGNAGLAKIEAAVARLAATDLRRGIDTELVFLDDASLGRWAVKSGGSKAFKRAIDHVFGLQERPDYVVILGGPDVVPHQDLKSPLSGPAMDDDPVVPSDLPYACDAAAADAVSAFVAPSRVVSRIPDEQGKQAKLVFLLGLLDAASKWKPGAKVGKKHFGLSAKVWERSTALSLRRLFGAAGRTKTSPLAGPKWKKSELSPQWHFINCHGAQVDPKFYGQLGRDYPPAHDSTLLPRLIARGTVAAAECCYGAQVYDEADSDGPAICLTYLREGAIAFMGSTTIAYGPADSNDSADLICRFFLESCRAGASTGRALLEARQRFVKEAGPLSPVDLKTLAQFVLLGDGSLRAVRVKGAAPEGASTKKSFVASRAHMRVRSFLVKQASLIDRGSQSAASRSSVSPPAVQRQLAEHLAELGYAAVGKAAAFLVTGATSATARKSLSGPPSGITKFHVIHASAVDGEAAALPKSAARSTRKAMRASRSATDRIPKGMILVGRETAGKVVGVQKLFAHSVSPRPMKRCSRPIKAT